LTSGTIPEEEKQVRTKKGVLALSVLVIALLMIPAAAASAAWDEDDIIYKKMLGGSGNDRILSVAATDDGFVAAGGADKFNNGDWLTVKGKGGVDAIIVKYDRNGGIIWKKNFGGAGADYFNSVTVVPGGFVAVGYSEKESIGNGDWTDHEAKGNSDAIIVKFDDAGKIVWKTNFGGWDGIDYFYSVTAVPDGVVAVGYSDLVYSDDGDWGGVEEHGGPDAIIVMFDADGNATWRKNIGGAGADIFYSVTAVPDGVIAAGCSFAESFGNGSWKNFSPKGGPDATAVRFNFNGDIVWMKSFGGEGADRFYSVVPVSDGAVFAGYSEMGSFGNGDWTGFEGKDGVDASDDAIIVKLDGKGNKVWMNNFGGSGTNRFYGIAAVPDGFVATGYASSFGDADWDNIEGKGGADGIMTKFNLMGQVMWMKNFGGTGNDFIEGVAAVSDGIIAAGYSSRINGDWTGPGMFGKGLDDSIIIKHTLDPQVYANNITGVPDSMTAGKQLTLKGTAFPLQAVNKDIVWSLKDAGTTEAVLEGDVLSAAAEGTVVVTATIEDGCGPGIPLTKDFSITVSAGGSSVEIGTEMMIGLIAAAFVIVCAAAGIVMMRKKHK
jgi:hypothetical protein